MFKTPALKNPTRNFRRWSMILPFILLCITACRNNHPGRLLVFMNDGIPGEILNELQRLAAAEKMTVDTTSSFGRISGDSLAGISAVIFLGMSADTLEYKQQNALQRFEEAGGGVMCIYPPKDTIRNWPWWNAFNSQLKKSAQRTLKTGNAEGKIYLANLPVTAENVREGFQYVKEARLPDYRRATTPEVPEENRFVVEVLETNLYEPMEMVIFPDGRVLYVERRGDIKIYDPRAKKSKTIDRFDVSITGNYEDGILGVTLDPDFENNHWIYINYSPAGAEAKQNVSRFEMRGDSIIRSSEKIVLEIPTQRETCCHSGGHLTFGPGKNLYISTGDNTSSKESDGFSPIDERPGRAPFDAQKSSGNTHDLRGKILRIHPEPDGTYTIPDGNLFPKDGSRGKPEIYVMGTRNAFRFSVDPKNGHVYWGDVGPDGGKTTERGPESFDEFNQAKKPGNYGWPYFVADNKAYADFDFATNRIGPLFDPAKPENTSPNNTGDRFLPPAQKPMIWYPYGQSAEFPMLGIGSRSAMAGPVYYVDDYKNAPTRFPEYFNGKLFIYEWARSWVKVVSFDENRDLAVIEPFLPSQEWYKPIDIKFGPDGSMYVLQYGANYFEHNPDSRLVKITFVEGNREPVAKLEADKTVGAAPLTVNLSAEKSSDFDKNEKLSYAWQYPGSSKQQIAGKNAVLVFDKPGVYRPSVTVTDASGKSASAQLEIRVGNEPPLVEISTEGSNRSFYFNGKKMDYAVQVTDREDGTVEKGVDVSSVFVSFDYLPHGNDLALLESNAGAGAPVKYIRGKTLVENSDCKTCHQMTDQSIGPSYSAIATRYKGQNKENTIAEKILSGGNGNWGKNMMAAHPQHTQDEARQMAAYILSLAGGQKSLPLKGSVSFDKHGQASEQGGYYVMRAAYTDKGAPEVGHLTASTMLTLRNSTVQAENFETEKTMQIEQPDGFPFSYVGNIHPGAYMKLANIDLTDISGLTTNISAGVEGTVIEVRIDSLQGPVTGKSKTGKTGEQVFVNHTIPVKPYYGRHDLYLVFSNESGATEQLALVNWVRFNDNGHTIKQ